MNSLPDFLREDLKPRVDIVSILKMMYPKYDWIFMENDYGHRWYLVIGLPRKKRRQVTFVENVPRLNPCDSDSLDIIQVMAEGLVYWAEVILPRYLHQLQMAYLGNCSFPLSITDKELREYPKNEKISY